MPAKSAKQYRYMQAVLAGKVKSGPPKEVAREFVEKTPPAKRREYSKKK